jgi:hypothetical protein
MTAAHADPDACRSPALEARFAAQSEAMRTWLLRMEPYAAALHAIGGEAPPAPRWDQDWFPRLDAAMAYTIVRTVKPRRIVEVGSGHSTRFYGRAIADGGLAAELLSIDPAPRAATDGVPALSRMSMPVQQAGLEPFRMLSAGDILSIDSSHILMPGSDVDFLLNAVLPVLPPGLLVHFHDIFLPDAYPAAWSWRGYNEQSAVALLVQQAGWRIAFASHYAVTRLGDAVRESVAGTVPLFADAVESSLWMTST